ncbi:MAG: EAL domain-containing protein [Lachnospiraceae bacterium]|nr:EAL domain-containing protein [Lachnospiraceae bacterium]
MLYNIDFDIAAVIISLFILFHIFVKKGLKTASNRVFLLLVASNLAASVTDIISSILNSYPDTMVIWQADLVNTLYLALHNSMTPLMLLYIFCLLGDFMRMNRLLLKAVFIPVFSEYILLLLNPFFRFVFYYDENGIYRHGLSFPLFYVFAFGYMAACIVILMVRRENITKTKRRSLIFIIVATIISLALQMVYPYLLLEIFAQTLGFLGMLLSIENQDDIVNHISGAYNRYAFIETAPEYLGNTDSVIIVIKLQELSYYNTTIGMTRTNEFLRKIASFLSKADRRLFCYDLGGGNFVLLGSGMTDDEIEMLTGKTAERFRSAWELNGSGVMFPAMLCAGRTDRFTSMEELLLIADSSFDGNETVIVEIEKVMEKNKRKIQIESLIREAIAKKRFEVYYQPIWGKAGGYFHSAEALIRLNTEEFGFVSPEEFIPIAEESGLIVEIGAFVFDEVCRFYKSNELEKSGIDYMEVNLSTVQCMDPELVNSFKETLKKYSLSSERINLEITESAAADNRKVLKDNVNVLNGLGFSFSLDDYGTGYSNFSYMFDLPFSIIKLDKSILWKALNPNGSEGPKSSGILLSNTIRMMKEMGYKVLVEGVETEEQKVLLEKLGCDYFQGYYFSKPVPGDVFLKFIKEANADQGD